MKFHIHTAPMAANPFEGKATCEVKGCGKKFRIMKTNKGNLKEQIQKLIEDQYPNQHPAQTEIIPEILMQWFNQEAKERALRCVPEAYTPTSASLLINKFGLESHVDTWNICREEMLEAIEKEFI